jgi:uncharacterized protein with GYD domain
MAKFLIRARYTQSGMQGAVKEGFAARESYIKGLIKSMGGTTETWYWAYGEDDILVIIDAEPPAALAISIVVNESGAVHLSTTPLITSAEMDQARGMLPAYRAPGG